ncbi:MAG: glycosyltransferase family 4 protein [Chloroflexaceae bacterium]
MNLLRHLAVRHTVDLITFTQGPVGEVQRDELQRMCASITAIQRPSRPIRHHHRVASLVLPEPASVRATWSAEMAEAVTAAASRLQPDIVIAFEPDVVPYVLPLQGVPLILEELELAYILEHYLQQSNPLLRLRYWLTALKHRHYIATVLRRFIAITVVSAREATLVRNVMRDYPIEVSVVPNGADLEGCLHYHYDPEPDTLIYPGALTYAANLDAMRYFLAEIFPRIRQLRPQVRLRITGKHTPEQRAALPRVPGVELTGYVTDVHALISRSAVEVVPLRQGGGTRLKILEALALGTPVISTTKGAEGLDLSPGRDLLIADTPAAFAETTVRLLTNPEERVQLSAHGRRSVAERYDWRSIGTRFVALVEMIATQKKLTYDTHVHAT